MICYDRYKKAEEVTALYLLSPYTMCTFSWLSVVCSLFYRGIWKMFSESDDLKHAVMAFNNSANLLRNVHYMYVILVAVVTMALHITCLVCLNLIPYMVIVS